MEKRIKIDFYRVKMPDNATSAFEDMIDEVNDLPEDESRNVDVRGFPIRMQSCGKNNRMRWGEMIRIRMDELPLKASLNGNIELLDLEDDEGLGEETAFLYHASLGVLIIQRNRFGVSASSFTDYFHFLSKSDQPIILEPILQKEALKKLREMGIIRKFTVRIAGLNHLNIFEDEKLSISSLAKLSKTFEAPSVSISLSMGHNQGSLTHGLVLKTVRSLLPYGSYHRDSPVKKIEVTGKDDDLSDTEVLDLLQYRMVETVDISLDENKRLSLQSRSAALQSAWQRRREELSSMFQ